MTTRGSSDGSADVRDRPRGSEPNPASLPQHQAAAAREGGFDETDLWHVMAVTQDLLAVADPGGRFHKLGPGWEELLGHSRRELLGRPFLEFVHPDDVEATRHHLARLSRPGPGVAGFRNRYLVASGGHVWLDWRAVAVATGDGTRIYATARDVSHSVEVLALAQRQRAIADHAFTNAAYPIWIVDGDGLVEVANERFATLFGCTSFDCRGRAARDFFSTRSTRPFWEREPADEPLVSENGSLLAPEEEIPVRLTAMPLPSATHERHAWVCHVEDLRTLNRLIGITDELEEKRAQLARERENAARLQKVMHSVAHELANPISVLMLQSHRLGVLLEGEPAAQQVKVMERMLRRVRQTLENMLAFRSDDEPLRLIRRRVDVDQTVADLVHLFQAQAEAHGMRFEPALEPVGAAELDEARLTQALMNLLQNAIKYSPTNSTVRLVARRDGTYLRFEVQDEGYGIRREAQERVFDLFERFHEERATGLGIGLHVTKRIVRAHEGEIEVASDGEGRGSTFIVRIPAQ